MTVTWTNGVMIVPATSTIPATMSSGQLAAVQATDQQLSRLFETLESYPADESWAVILTADHGEELLERGWFGHTITLYDELVRVPLIVRGPGISPDRNAATPVSLRELGPALVGT